MTLSRRARISKAHARHALHEHHCAVRGATDDLASIRSVGRGRQAEAALGERGLQLTYRVGPQAVPFEEFLLAPSRCPLSAHLMMRPGMIIGVGDPGQLAPEQDDEDRRAGEGEPERRRDAESGGQRRRRSPSRRPGRRRRRSVLTLLTRPCSCVGNGPLPDGDGGGAPDERVGAEDEEDHRGHPR